MLAIGLPPPTPYISERNVVGLLHIVATVFNDNTIVVYEIFHDAKRDVLDMFAR